MTTDKSAAPERIWAGNDGYANRWDWEDPIPEWVPYTRSDLIPAMLQKARNAALREAERAAGLAFHTGAGANEMLAAHNGGIIMAKNHILALIDTSAPPTPAEPAGDALREALEPFAALADRYDPPEGDDADTCFGSAVPTLGDLRRARAALAAAPAPQPELRFPHSGMTVPEAVDLLQKIHAPQPDREALVEVIRDSGWSCLDGPEAIADALLASGMRLPAGDALLATKVRDAAAQSRDVFSGSCDHTRQGIDYMEQLLLAAIRVVEGGE